MSYNALADIIGRVSEDVLIQLTDDKGLGVIDTSKVDEAITLADGEVDGYCGKRYVVPFSPVPAFVQGLALDLAVYNLFSLRENMPENRKARYENAIKALGDIAKGIVTLGVQTPTPPTETFSTATPQVVQTSGRFSPGKLKGF